MEGRENPRGSPRCAARPHGASWSLGGLRESQSPRGVRVAARTARHEEVRIGPAEGPRLVPKNHFSQLRCTVGFLSNFLRATVIF